MEHCSTNIYPFATTLLAADRIELKRVYLVADAVEMLFYGLIREDFMQSRWFKLKRVVSTSRLLENIGSTPDWRAEALQADRHDKMLMKFRAKREQKWFSLRVEDSRLKTVKKEKEKPQGRQ